MGLSRPICGSWASASTARSSPSRRLRRLRRGARDRALHLADLERRLALPERRRAAVQARPDRRRRPRAGRHRPRRRPRPPDAVRRQPRPARAAHRRRARVRPRPGRRIDAGTLLEHDSPRGGRDPRRRAARGRAAGRGAPGARPPPPASTGCCGPAAAPRATRRTPATAPRPRPTDGPDPRGAAVPDLAVLEGFHALKHALRFDAEILEVVAGDPAYLEQLATALAPDLEGRFTDLATKEGLPKDEVLTVARRPVFDLKHALARPGPIVFLEAPRHMGNLGAAIRVAAAADAAAVLTTGHNDPWHPDAIRGSAGLHFALPVARIDAAPATTDRPLIADRPRRRGAAGPRAHDPGLRLRAPRPQPGAARRRRRAGANPDARRRLEPEPGDLGGRRALRPHGAVVDSVNVSVLA